MKYCKWKAFLLAVAMIATALNRCHADVLFYAPVAASASSTVGSDFAVGNLFDAPIDASFIDVGPGSFSGLNFSENYRHSWAADGFAGATLVLDMGTSRDFNGLVYAQRSFDATSNDDWGSVDVWGLNSDPGPATDGLPGTLGAPQSTFALIQNESATLRRYDFSTSSSNRYFVLRFHTGDTGPANPGGQELRLFTVPEPATWVLVTSIGIFAAGRLGLRRRKQ